MVKYVSSSPLGSLHIPKTAGTSLRDVLQGWFPDGRLWAHYPAEGQIPAREAIVGDVCVHGHFNGARGHGIWAAYPDVAQFITFFREPYARFVSQWIHLRNTGASHPELEDFDRWVHGRADQQQAGRNDFSFIWHLPRPPGTSSVDEMFDRNFVYVGIVEQLDRSVDALALALGKPPAGIRFLNRRQATFELPDFARWRPFYEKHFVDEYELYEKAFLRNKASY